MSSLKQVQEAVNEKIANFVKGRKSSIILISRRG